MKQFNQNWDGVTRPANLPELKEDNKTFYQQNNIGKAKYTISFHDGVKKHKDGSAFFDIKIFKNKTDLLAFQKKLLEKGYSEKKSFNENWDGVGRPANLPEASESESITIQIALNRAWNAEASGLAKKVYSLKNEILFLEQKLNNAARKSDNTVSTELLDQFFATNGFSLTLHKINFLDTLHSTLAVSERLLKKKV